MIVIHKLNGDVEFFNDIAYLNVTGEDGNVEIAIQLHGSPAIHTYKVVTYYSKEANKKDIIDYIDSSGVTTFAEIN